MASETVTVKIAGRVVAGGYLGSHEWPDTMGIKAPEVTWALDPQTAEYVLSQKEVEITIQPPRGQATTWKRVVVVKEAPSRDPLIRNVVLSNVLWYLNKIQVRRIYNQRQPSGATRILGTSSNQPKETLQKTAQVIYAPSSLKGGGSASNGLAPFNADEILRDVAAIFERRVAAFGVAGLKFNLLGRSRGDYIPNDVFIKAPGAIALGHALGIAGGLDVRVSPDGSLEIVNAFMGAERMTIARAVNYSLENMGTLRWIRMNHAAPREINVLYVRVMEFRADAWEQSPTGTQTAIDMGNYPVLVNMGVVTDQTLTVGGHVLAEGTPHELNELLDAIENIGDKPPWCTKTFNRQTALDLYFSSLIDDNFVTDPNGNISPSTEWAARVAMLRGCLRRVYRLNPTFASRCVPGTIKTVRAQLADAATGMYQKSPVYMDHARRFFARGQKGESLHGGNNHFIPPNDGQTLAKGYAKNYGETFLTSPVPIGSCYQAPVELHLLDSVTGLVRIEPLKDPFGNIAETIPSLVTQIPTPNAFKVVQGGGHPYWDDAGLSYSHRVVTVMTATPAGANNEAQLHQYVVSAASALQRLGVAADAVRAEGPPMDIAIDQTPTLSARFAWEDSDRVKILACFTSPDGSKIAATLIPVNDLELQDYSNGVAAALMAAMLDHYEGRASIAFNPSIRPLGSLLSVTHTVTSDGELFTTLDCKQVNAPVQPEHFLSAQTRANLFQRLGAQAAA